MTTKKRIPYVARYPGPIEGHAINLAKKFYPKLCAYYDFDDLLQDAYEKFMEVKAKYPHVDNRAWFMSLFSRSFHNHLVGLLQHRSTRYDFIEDSPTEIDEPATVDLSLFSIMLKELPKEIQDLLAIFAGEASTKQQPKGRRRLLLEELRGMSANTALRTLCKMYGVS